MDQLIGRDVQTQGCTVHEFDLATWAPPLNLLWVILNLSIELIVKPQALDKTFYYKCTVTKREADRPGVGRFSKKSFKRVLRKKKSLKS